MAIRSAANQAAERTTRRLTRAPRTANLAACLTQRRLPGPTFDTRSFETNEICKTNFDIVVKPRCCQPHSRLSQCLTWCVHSREAPAAASATTRSRYPAHAGRLLRPSLQGPHAAASQRTTNRAARRKEAAGVAILTAHGFLPVSAQPAPAPPTRWSSPAAEWWGNTAPVGSVRMAQPTAPEPPEA